MLDCGNTRLYELLKNKELEVRMWTAGHARSMTASYPHADIAQRLKDAQRTDESATGAAAERRGRPPKVRSNGSAAP